MKFEHRYLFLFLFLGSSLFGWSQSLNSYLRQYKKHYNEVLVHRGMRPIDYPYFTDEAISEYIGFLDEYRANNIAMLFYAYETSDSTLKTWVIDGLSVKAKGERRITPQELVDLERRFVAHLRNKQHTAKVRGAKVVQTEASSDLTIQQELADVLFPADLDSVLLAYKCLLVSPVLNLGTIPWYCLQPFEDGEYMIDKWNVQIIESLNHFSSLAREYKDQNQFMTEHDKVEFIPEQALVIGNPRYGACDMPDLPGAEKEARYVAEQLQVEMLTGTEVTLDNICTQDTSGISEFRGDLIYIASHAVSSYDKPMEESYIYLSSTSDSCHRINARQILNTRKKKGSIVVLSACETGKGRNLTGGVIGLSRSFLINGQHDGYGKGKFYGAQIIVMSLWKIDDEATQKLMLLFFEEMQNEQVYFPITGLRNAILRYRQFDDNPINWGAFQTMGLMYPGYYDMQLILPPIH